MKIRHPLLISALGLLAACFIRLWIFTVRYRHVPVGPDLTPHRPDLRERVIYAFWHEDMLVPAYQYGGSSAYVLISQHADGQLIAAVVRHLGLNVIYGSTTRGGASALLKLVDVSRTNHIVITPDGPRGPRRCVQIGIVYVAARTGLPIVPTAFGYVSAGAGSWDHMALPRPFSRVIGVTLPPIYVPPTDDKDVLESYREQVEQAMRHATDLAEAAAGGKDILLSGVGAGSSEMPGEGP